MITTEPAFKIKESDGLCYVCNTSLEGSPVIETHLGTTYPGLKRKVAELLLDDLNSLPKANALTASYNFSLVYCVLSTLIEAKGEYESGIDLSFCTQWDRIFRLDPAPPLMVLERNAISKIVSFLGRYWTDLPLNYAQSLVEMDELKVPKVPQRTINRLQNLLNSFNEAEDFAVDLLFNFFNRVSISSAMLWVAGVIDNKDIQMIDLHFYHAKMSSRLTRNQKAEIEERSERLTYLRRLLEISKEQELIPVKLKKTRAGGHLKTVKKDFKTIKIGHQEWMAENLSVTVFRNGDPIPQIRTKKAWEEAKNKKLPGWCYYDFKASNGKIYGKLYNWYAVSDPRRLAPEGWRIADSFDWQLLIEHFGDEKTAGKHLKGKERWPNPEANINSSGFNALPAGMYGTSMFNQIDDAGFFWTEESFMAGDTPNGVYYCVNKRDNVVRGGYFQWCFFSVRCIK